MKKTRTFLMVAATLAWCSVAQASITDATASGDNNVSCIYTFSPIDNTLTLNETQVGVGMITGDITTDVPGDPTLTIQNVINNDTGYAWPAYHVNVFMSQPFTIANTIVLNPGWTGSVTQQPVLSGSTYGGQIDYLGGTPVLDGQILSFSYQITFSGTASFSQELIPVPEPGPLSLVLGGGLLLAGCMFARQRRSRKTVS
jgi:hypothetical protein